MTWFGATLVPLAIPLLLMRANLREIIQEGGPTLVAFACGAVGTIIGTVVGYYLIPLGPEGWKLAAIFCSTYIGGSMNYVAASQSVQLQAGDLLSAGVAADNLAMTIYFLVLFALPSIPLLRKRFRTQHDEDAAKLPELDVSLLNRETDPLHPLDLAKGLALSAVVCATGFSLEKLIAIRGSGILIITALIIVLATTCHRQLARIAGADTVGTFLM